LKHEALSLCSTHIGEKTTMFAKAYKIHMKWYCELLGNTLKTWGTYWEHDGNIVRKHWTRKKWKILTLVFKDCNVTKHYLLLSSTSSGHVLNVICAPTGGCWNT
jgi:hypothetical protein